MNVFQLSIAVGALFTAYVAWNMPNAVRYIVLGSIVAIACDVYYAAGLNWPAGVTFCCDAFICWYIQRNAREKWDDVFLQGVFLTSAAISLTKFVGEFINVPNLSLVADMSNYRLYLELANWAALAVILLAKVKPNARLLGNPWLLHVRGFVAYLHRPCSRSHWLRAK